MRARRLGRLLLALAAIVAALALAGTALAAPPQLVIVGDTSIAGFRVKRDGTLEGAIAALGTPTARRSTSRASCRIAWTNLGVWMGFYNLGGRDACSRRYGYFSYAVIVTRRWRTSKGLSIGDSRAKLRRLFPNARYHKRPFKGWWLVVRPSPFGVGGTYPGLLARLGDGRVVRLVVRFPAGGD